MNTTLISLYRFWLKFKALLLIEGVCDIIIHASRKPLASLSQSPCVDHQIYWNKHKSTIDSSLVREQMGTRFQLVSSLGWGPDALFCVDSSGIPPVPSGWRAICFNTEGRLSSNILSTCVRSTMAGLGAIAWCAYSWKGLRGCILQEPQQPPSSGA